jgi:electron transfer flavoprotein alpha subunit
MPTLVLAEHDNAVLNPATGQAVTAAIALGEPVHVLVAGEGCASVAEAAARLAGVEMVLMADDPLYARRLAESVTALIRPLTEHYGAVVAAATSGGKSILPRLAALMDVQPVSEIVKILGPNTFERPVYAGSLIETVKAPPGLKILTVRMSAFAPREAQPPTAIKNISIGSNPCLSEWVSGETPPPGRPELSFARIVVSGGRGIGTKENVARLEKLADRLKAAVGASRAAVDMGLIPNACQVGQNGRVVAPDLYIALGISGAIQHVAGMRDAKLIAAIDRDEDAPIFRIADIGLVADLSAALAEMERVLTDYGY